MIEKLSVYDIGMVTKQVRDGYDLKTVPELHHDNIAVLMDKINELIEVLNRLTNEGK